MNFTKKITIAVVGHVIDGDTFDLTNGKRVRLIGVDAPELGRFGNEDEPFAIEATKFVKNTIEGKEVWLQNEGSDTDIHDRLRRHAWLRQPTDVNCKNQAESKLLSSQLLLHGYAKVMIFGDVAHENLFKNLEAIARFGGAGIWSIKG